MIRVLLDENMPGKLARFLVGHDVRTVVGMGWGSLANGRLLAAAHAAGFTRMVTLDRNIRHQQNLPPGFGVIVVPTNDRRMMQALAPHVLAALTECADGDILLIPAFGTTP